MFHCEKKYAARFYLFKNIIEKQRER
jgi:hypothetical protein